MHRLPSSLALVHIFSPSFISPSQSLLYCYFYLFFFVALLILLPALATMFQWKAQPGKLNCSPPPLVHHGKSMNVLLILLRSQMVFNSLFYKGNPILLLIILSIFLFFSPSYSCSHLSSPCTPSASRTQNKVNMRQRTLLSRHRKTITLRASTMQPLSYLARARYIAQYYTKQKQQPKNKKWTKYPIHKHYIYITKKRKTRKRTYNII